MFGFHLQSGLASSLKRLAPCRLISVRGKTSDEGFMGARGGSCFPRVPGSHRF